MWRLELVVSLGPYQLPDPIFHIPGVYLCTAEICGWQLFRYFRVTEYEMLCLLSGNQAYA